MLMRLFLWFSTTVKIPWIRRWSVAWRTAVCRNRWNCTFEVLSTLRLSGGLFGLHFFVKAVQPPRQQRNVNDQIFGQLVSLERKRKDPAGLGPGRTLYHHHNISFISSSWFMSEKKLFNQFADNMELESLFRLIFLTLFRIRFQSHKSGFSFSTMISSDTSDEVKKIRYTLDATK